MRLAGQALQRWKYSRKNHLKGLKPILQATGSRLFCTCSRGKPGRKPEKFSHHSPSLRQENPCGKQDSCHFVLNHISLFINIVLLPYLSRLLISFNQHNKSTAQYHSNAKKLSHCEKMPYRPQPRIWFSYKFNTKSHYSIANNIQA